MFALFASFSKRNRNSDHLNEVNICLHDGKPTSSHHLILQVLFVRCQIMASWIFAIPEVYNYHDLKLTCIDYYEIDFMLALPFH